MGLYVVGMHRSGTSAITEALAALPFDLPEPHAMVGGNESNPRGHWEVSALTDFNQDLLERAGAGWLAPSTGAIAEMARLSQPEMGLDAQAQRVFDDAFPGPGWLFKDPRLSITLPFWRRVLGPNPAVLVLRDPMAIARSLRTRNRLAIPFGLALWERYLRSSVVAMEGMAVHVTTFSGIAAGGQPVVDLVEFAAKSLNVAIPSDIEERIHQVIDPELRHHDGGPDTDHDLLSPEQAQLLELLYDAEGNHAEFKLGIESIPETPGLDLTFESAAAFEMAMQLEAAELSDSLTTSFDRREAEWSDRFADIEEYEQKRQQLLLAEIDRLRDLLASAEHVHHALSAEGLQKDLDAAQLKIELDTAAHHRNLNAIELDRLKSRRAVRYAMRFADGMRKAGILDKEDTDGNTKDSTKDNREDTALAAAAPSDGARPLPVPGRRSGSEFAAVADAIESGYFDRPLTVIIPIYNAFEALQRCLEAFRRFTPDEVHLVLIDDASPDERITQVIAQIADRPNTTLLANDRNLGFTNTVNRGLAEHFDAAEAAGAAPGDVVILNSDTLVTPRWTQRLRAVAHEDPTYATVTPLSNAAGVFSFTSPLPGGPDAAARLSTVMARGSNFLRPTGPTGNGFCLFVKAEALAVVSELDGEAFPRGYGEENDFCMKLVAEGFTHVIADDVAIFHEESASFGNTARDELIEAGMAVLDERYPEYRSKAQAFVESSDFVAARANASAAIESNDGTMRRRALTVIHDGGGGTEYHVNDLTAAMRDQYEPLLLVPHGNDLVLWSADNPEERIEVTRWTLSKPWDVRRVDDPEVARVAVELLTRFNIEFVHVHHLIGHSFDLPRVAKALGIPVALTLHDFYMACPSVNLLDNNNTFCGGTCTAGDGRCNTPIWLENDIDLKHRFVHLWRDESRELIESVDALITPSHDTREHFSRIFGTEIGRKISVIEHGRDFDRPRVFSRSPSEDEPILILLVGAINASKGAALAEELARVGKSRNVLVELLGDVEPDYEGAIRAHGKYHRDDLPALLAGLRPTFIGVFSIWAETHCYVVSEAWANGVPVLVGPLGAPSERVRAHGGGVIAASLDPTQIVELAVETARDRTGYTELAAQATVANVRSTAEMADDYRVLYADLLRTKGA